MNKYRVMFSGDTHLSSRNHGGHSDYAKESLYYFEKLNQIAKENKVTHDIRLGDFTYGKFHDLKYRLDVEEQLRIAKENVDGNLYIIKGNHDKSSTGMTEYEFYLKAGWFNGATNLTLGNVNINMVNYGETNTTKIIEPSNNTIDIIAAHEYMVFSDTQLPNYGTAIELDHKEDWYGVDMIVLGHIHNFHKFSGTMIKNGMGKRVVVEYLNCPCRPAYTEGLDETWHIMILNIDEQVSVQELEIPLLELNECFDFDKMETEKMKSMQKKVDLSDIIQRVGNYSSMIGDPETIIRNMKDVDIRYRNKALELLASD